jgi:5-methylcytosine-specific restriction endonuclease McrA
LLIDEAGGACLICGYDRCVGALHFHHLDPETKEFGISRRGFTRSIQKMREEAAKCVLLCSNCHAEVEAGIATLPVVAAA